MFGEFYIQFMHKSSEMNTSRCDTEDEEDISGQRSIVCTEKRKYRHRLAITR